MRLSWVTEIIVVIVACLFLPVILLARLPEILVELVMKDSKI
jgi:hypothetical protein